MSTTSLRRLERLQDYFVRNDDSVGDDGGHQGPVELDPCLLYDYSDDDYDIYLDKDVEMLDSGLEEEPDTIGTKVYATTSERLDDSLVSSHLTAARNTPAKRLLAHHGKKKEADVRRWKEEYEREFREHCTFAPSLLQDAVKTRLGRDSAFYNIPIEKRLSLEWRRKEERLQDATKRADRDATFQPQINQLSRQIAEKRRERMKHGMDTGKHKIITEYEDNVHKGFMASRQSDNILQLSESIPRGFQDRQDYFVSKYQRNQSVMLEERGMEHDREFRAKIPADIVVSSNRLVKQMLETRKERIDRMAHGDAAEIEARRMKRKQEMDAQFRYKPELNKKSLEMASSEEGRVGHAILKRVQDYKDGRYNECTFKPDTSKPYVHGFYCEYMAPKGNSKYSISKALREGSIDRYLSQIVEDRQVKAREAEEERLAKELEECSFKPKINKHAVKLNPCDNPLHLMPGMQGFYQKLELIEKKNADLAEREKACFVQPDHWTPAPTVVQPFNLSYTRMA